MYRYYYTIHNVRESNQEETVREVIINDDNINSGVMKIFKQNDLCFKITLFDVDGVPVISYSKEESGN